MSHFKLTFHLINEYMPQVSLWEAESFFAPQDFVIAGAGLAGLWTAVELKTLHPSASVLVLERGHIPTGASTRNAGFACFGSPTEMISDAILFGEATMWSNVEMRYKGISKIREYFGDRVIEYDNCRGYECFAANEERIETVTAKLGWLNNGMKTITGKSEAFKWANEKIIPFGFSGFGAMIENKLEGGLHSGKLVQALLQKAQQAGVRFLFGTSLQAWRSESSSVKLKTDHGNFVAGKLVLATNAFLSEMLDEPLVTPARGQILVTEPIPGLQLSGTFHYDEGYFYFRNVGNRILLGGARNTSPATEATLEMEITAPIQLRLEQFASKHLLNGKAINITHRWSGIMAFTKDKRPIIKQVTPTVYAISACNGMGVALTPIAAAILATMVAGTFNLNQNASCLHLSPTI